MTAQHDKARVYVKIMKMIVSHFARSCLVFTPLLASGFSEVDAADLNLKTTCHAAGDNVTDDAVALRDCLDLLEKNTAAGSPTTLHIPAGLFRISGAAGAMPTLSHGGSIIGDGPHATTLRLDADYDGDVFAWDEAWTDHTANGPGIDLAHDATGPTLTGLRITGSRTATRTQNAVVFYDRNDHVLLRDLEVDDLDGDCLSIGQTRHMPEAYMRESAFYNVKCFSTGARHRAAVSIGSTTRLGSDASNEIDIYKLAIFDTAGQGLSIRNANRGSATRGVRFFGLRVEKTSAEAVSIGDPADLGQVAGITVFDLTVINAGQAALRIAGNPHGPQPYGIRVVGGSLGPGNARGIEIDSGRLIDIALDGVDAPNVLGVNVGTDISMSGNGGQVLWHIAGVKPPGTVANPLELRSPFNLRGLPATGDRVGTAALRADLRGEETRAMTMDGQKPNAYNCFNPSYGQTYSLGLRVMLQDRDVPARSFNWVMPAATLSAWYGPHSAQVTPGPFSIVQNQAADSRVDLTADRANGCLSLLVHAPKPSQEHWTATGLITYARAP